MGCSPESLIGLSDPETISYEISAASDFGDKPAEKVFVCKLVGPPHAPKIKQGDNPIHVERDSVDAQEAFSDAHPSYVVESGEVDCEVPNTEEPGSEDAPEGSSVDTTEQDELGSEEAEEETPTESDTDE